MIKVGIGQDSHAFDENKKLLLGGIEIPNAPGLHGNSDADVVLHALCNALGSAVGKGSLSNYSHEMCKDGITDSSKYLEVALGYVSDAFYKVNNISIAIEGKRPKLEGHFSAMKERIAKICALMPEDIGITATTGEELTAVGKGEGLQAIVIVSLVPHQFKHICKRH